MTPIIFAATQARDAGMGTVPQTTHASRGTGRAGSWFILEVIQRQFNLAKIMDAMQAGFWIF
jgi:hypothetical protein